jgi:hypothetical protein
MNALQGNAMPANAFFGERQGAVQQVCGLHHRYERRAACLGRELALGICLKYSRRPLCVAS